MTPAGGGPARRPQTSGPGYRAALGLIGLAGLVHMLRSRSFNERMIVGVIAVAALARLGQENGASAFARLAAWDKRQVDRFEHKAEQQVERLEHTAERQAQGLKAKAGEQQA
jgi:hypothetical protein